jgi:hypothetical protein
MCRTLAFLPRDDRAKWVNRNADWIDRDTRDNILSLGPYWDAPRSLGDHLEVYDKDRERLGIRTIEACDVTIEQRTEINEVKNTAGRKSGAEKTAPNRANSTCPSHCRARSHGKPKKSAGERGNGAVRRRLSQVRDAPLCLIQRVSDLRHRARRRRQRPSFHRNGIGRSGQWR